MRRRHIMLAAGAAVVAPAVVRAQEILRSSKANYRLVTLARDLEQPWAIAFLPDGRILITERPGRLRLFANGRLERIPLAGVPKVYARGQGGLLDVCLHPQFAQNRLLYLSYSGEGPGGAATVGVRAELAADAQKPGAEILVAPQVLGLEARTLGGEAVGPAQDGELLAEQPGGPGDPLRQVVGLGIAHKAYLQVQRGQGRREIRLPGRQAKSSANAPDHPGAERIVGDEEDPSFELAAGNGLGHIVQQGCEAQALYAVFSHAGADPAFLQFALHPAAPIARA